MWTAPWGYLQLWTQTLSSSTGQRGPKCSSQLGASYFTPCRTSIATATGLRWDSVHLPPPAATQRTCHPVAEADLLRVWSASVPPVETTSCAEDKQTARHPVANYWLLRHFLLKTSRQLDVWRFFGSRRYKGAKGALNKDSTSPLFSHSPLSPCGSC
ncbi:hypothetical protein FQN60_004671 [Etheostoma spectabile]|uniref:Uncharacterized protein n=1 Tax=Etheostoma spectabile TaxID=54343 RepID=A0A5J5DKA5_9PERO|nr:hypothetical protein FQN60_004671 [Etheostoma spectabile]